jgi:signal transduction histidine kinase
VRLRSTLFLLASVTAVPLVVVAFAAVGLVFNKENASFVDAAKARNRATLQAVDAELRGTVNTLKALSASKVLARGDLSAFRDEAQAALATQPHWRNIVVLSPDGQHLANARLPQGSPLPRESVDPASLAKAVATRAPVVSDLALARHIGNEPSVIVRFPVVNGGQVTYVLSAVLDIAALQQILEQQQMPAGWVSGLVDTGGTLLARVPPLPLGTKASPDYLRESAKAPEGWYRGKTVDGRDTYTAFSRSQMSGWSIGYAIPSETITGGPARAAKILAFGLALSMLSAVLIGFWLSRRIARPIAELAHAAPRLESGIAPPKLGSAIDEVDALAKALRDAALAIRTRDDELVRRGEELMVQADELRRLDEHKTRFLAQVSHELRAPLAPLKNASFLLENSPDPQQQANAREVIRRQLALLSRLVDDFVDLGRIGRGELDLRLDRVSLERVLNESVDMVKPQMDAKRQVLLVRHAPEPLEVRGDADRLVQVVSNLMANACRYTPEQGTVEVTAARSVDGATITVSDDGVGFKPADAARIFDMFVRLAEPGSNAPGSLGIGLAVTRKIVEMHEGTIEAHSEGPGKGAVFTVTLPLHDRAAAGSRAQETEPA